MTICLHGCSTAKKWSESDSSGETEAPRELSDQGCTAKELAGAGIDQKRSQRRIRGFFFFFLTKQVFLLKSHPGETPLL